MTELAIMAGACIVKNKKILLLKQGKTSRHAYLWGPPGGHREKNESLIDTARREVKEETGLDINIKGVLEGGVKLHEDNNVSFVVLYYAEIKDRVNINLDNENDEYLWATLAEIKKDKYPLRDPLLKNVLIKALRGQVAPIDSFQIYG